MWKKERKKKRTVMWLPLGEGQGLTGKSIGETSRFPGNALYVRRV